MATVGPVRSRRSYCWEAAAPNSTYTRQCTKQYTRQCSRIEHQTEEKNSASDSAPQRNTRTGHQNNEVHQSRIPDKKQFMAEEYSKSYNRCSTDSKTVGQIGIHYTCPTAAE